MNPTTKPLPSGYQTFSLVRDRHLTQRIEQIAAILWARWPDALPLLEKMQSRCEQDSGFAELFRLWVAEGSTLRLRSLMTPFGDYAGSLNSVADLGFVNQVNALDTARFKAAIPELHESPCRRGPEPK